MSRREYEMNTSDMGREPESLYNHYIAMPIVGRQSQS